MSTVASGMDTALAWHRIQFGFTASFHYLFPQLTMGLALLIVVLKALALRRGDERLHDTARFWIRIFGLNFAMGVVTGIPMEFQFGANWAEFTRRTGGVIGQTLAMEGIFAFFLESSFLYLLVWGERRLGPRRHFLAAVALFVGSWLSAYFIVTTNAFMHRPAGHAVGPDGTLHLADLGAFLGNSWALVQYAHVMTAAVVTSAFVMAAVGAFWLLSGAHREVAVISLRTGVIAGLVAAVAVAFPTGDLQGKMTARWKPVALAAMEGRFQTMRRAEITMIGQPDFDRMRIDNPISVPGFLSFLAYGSFSSEVRGLEAYPRGQWPDNPELLYYSFHIMAGLGTLMIGVMTLAALLLLRGRLFAARPMLWVLMLAFPFPYIATAFGWLTAELGRQPWAVYGILRTAEARSPTVGGGAVTFSLLGFMGLYFVLGLAFLYLVGREIARGPASRHGAGEGGASAPASSA